MELREFTSQVPGFASLSHPAKILHFIWFLHAHSNKNRVESKDIRSCYAQRSEELPNLSLVLTRLMERRPKVLLQEAKGYYLEHKTHATFDEKYGQHETTIAVSQMLRDLPGRVADDAERIFLKEAITCYHSKAFRAANIMAWNLAYDHLLRWIIADPGRLSAFNSKISAVAGGKKFINFSVTTREDFEEFMESQVIEIAGSSGIFASKNTKTILEVQLKKRNLAAHPSLVTIGASQADDAITSLVQNVVLVLT